MKSFEGMPRKKCDRVVCKGPEKDKVNFTLAKTGLERPLERFGHNYRIDVGTNRLTDIEVK